MVFSSNICTENIQKKSLIIKTTNTFAVPQDATQPFFLEVTLILGGQYVITGPLFVLWSNDKHIESLLVMK